MAQADILTVTLNPALDLATGADAVEPGPKLRCDAPLADPGGGGINVARAVLRLDGTARALVALGGGTGTSIARLLADEGVALVPFDAPGETRQSLAVTDRATGAQYRFVLPGPDWSPATAAAALAAIVDAARPGGFVVLSGSQPPGVAAGFPGELAAALAAAGDARLVVDTSGAALRALAGGDRPGPAPEVLRMDGAEAEDLAGRALPGRADTARLAAGLVAAGAARRVIVARGADGSVMADPAGAWHCGGAEVNVVSAIGAGDSFTGAFALSLARGDTPGEALQWGVAAASAAVTTEATRLFDAALVGDLRPRCALSRL